MLGRALLGIGGAAESIEIDGGSVLQTVAEILPLADVIAQLSGQQTALKHAVKLHAHFIAAGVGAALQTSLIANDQQSIFRDIVHSGG